MLNLFVAAICTFSACVSSSDIVMGINAGFAVLNFGLSIRRFMSDLQVKSA